MSKQFITAEGLEKLKEELEELKTVKRRKIAERIQSAKELGDLSENAEYSEAKDEQAMNEARIAELEETVKNITTIDDRHLNSDVVHIGSTLVVKCNGETKEFTIVGSNEADPSKGKISNETPLAIAFLGHKSGDEVEVEIPSGKMRYEIVEIK